MASPQSYARAEYISNQNNHFLNKKHGDRQESIKNSSLLAFKVLLLNLPHKCLKVLWKEFCHLAIFENLKNVIFIHKIIPLDSRGSGIWEKESEFW